MPVIEQLRVTHVRNIEELSLDCHARFNLIYGPNGSGKTSLLEAIHILSAGRSFRTHINKRLINYAADSLTIFAQLMGGDRLGVQKDIKGQSSYRLNQTPCASVAELSRLLPVQVINPDSYELLTGGPKERRRFLDWGLFHVEQSFYSLWQRLREVLQQRNMGLRRGLSLTELASWDAVLSEVAEELDTARRRYVDELVPYIHKQFGTLLSGKLTVEYRRGWDAGESLQDVLQAQIDSDRRMGYTQSGPQRASLVFKIDGRLVEHVLSRGQQKTLVCALKLAQSELLREKLGTNCIFLIDDLAAELDAAHRDRLAVALEGLEAQVFLTGVELDMLQSFVKTDGMFHVKHLSDEVIVHSTSVDNAVDQA